MRQRVLWLLVAPLALAASQGGHWLAYRLAVPAADARAHELAATGHAYLSYAPVVGGVTLALALAALGVRAATAATAARPGARIARWPFGLVPAVTFAAQEHLERLGHGGVVPLHAYADRTFVLGIALQVPFGLAVYLLARLLLAGADRLGRLLAGSRASRARRLAALLRPASRQVTSQSPRCSPLALNLAGRAPPTSTLA